MGASYNVGRSETIPIEFLFQTSSGVDITDGDVRAEVLAFETGAYLDWADLTFKASGWTTKTLTLSYDTGGLYPRVGGLALADVTIPADVNILKSEYKATSATYSVVDAEDFDIFTMPPPHVVVPTALDGTVWDRMQIANLRAHGESVVYTPASSGVPRSIVAIVDKHQFIDTDSGDVPLVMTKPRIGLRLADLAGDSPGKGDTILSGSTTYETAQLPQNTGRGWLEADIRSLRT